ncbi:uncharacterized protein FOMMEDRAFT_86787, partial [Fomitiporia mediterranea MF3/22]|uniref:uncharacterized protein n=1 Tax=Fomitiporia mediterranea (strain MF3/22) TaxID=694068 RepID=UPI0004409C6D
LLADFFHWGLFGILTVQVYLYHLAFPRDRIAFKALVYTIYLAEVAQTFLVTHDAFFMYAQKYGHVDALDAVQTSWLAIPVLCGIGPCAAQLSYTYRIFILSRSKLLTFGISVIALTQATAGIAAGIQAHRAATYVLVESKAFIATTIWFSGSALCDFTIAASMTVLLRRCDSGTHATHALVSKLIRLIIKTGTLTATLTLAEVAMFFAFPHLTYSVCLSIIRAKLYSNSLLVIFNSRLRIGSQMDSTFISDGNLDNATRTEFALRETSRSLNSTIILRGIRSEDQTSDDTAASASMVGLHLYC